MPCELPQVHSKNRDRASAMARALNMTEFIPKSYIEQVRMGSLFLGEGGVSGILAQWRATRSLFGLAVQSGGALRGVCPWAELGAVQTRPDNSSHSQAPTHKQFAPQSATCTFWLGGSCPPPHSLSNVCIIA
jgi:hypothetical protein